MRVKDIRICASSAGAIARLYGRAAIYSPHSVAKLRCESVRHECAAGDVEPRVGRRSCRLKDELYQTVVLSIVDSPMLWNFLIGSLSQLHLWRRLACPRVILNSTLVGGDKSLNSSIRHSASKPHRPTVCWRKSMRWKSSGPPMNAREWAIRNTDWDRHHRDPFK